MRHFRTPRPRQAASWITLLIAGLMAGCTTVVHLPSPAHVALVQEGRASIVLLRLDLDWDGHPVKGLRGYGPTEYPAKHSFWMRQADLEATTPVENILRVVSPSREAKRSGWLFLELAPGNYWLSLVTPNSVEDNWPAFHFSTIPPQSGRHGYVDRGEFNPVPEFRLDVREGEPLLYAGTLKVRTKRRKSKGAPGEQFMVSAEIIDEHAAARDVCQKDLKDLKYQPLTTRLLRSYGQPLPPEAVHDLTPIGLATVSKEHLRNPDWVKRSMKLWMTPAGVLFSMAGSSGGDAYGAAGLVLLGIAYTPIGALGGLIHGTASHEKWQDTLEALDQELEDMKPNLALGKRLKTAWGAHLASLPIDLAEDELSDSNAPPDSLRATMVATLTRVQLREGSDGGTFAVEVAFRVRLWDVRQQSWIYDRSFVYTEFKPEARLPLDRPYETLLPASSPARPMSEYRGPEGRARFHQEIEHAIDLLVAELQFDLGLD